jgi:hypothetical protein
MPNETPHDGAGTIVTFNSVVYTVTNLVMTNTDPNADSLIDITHLALTTGNSVLSMQKPLIGEVGNADTGRMVEFDYIGKVSIADAVSGSFTLVVGGTTLINKPATCSSSVLTLAVNDAIRGKCSLKISRT